MKLILVILRSGSCSKLVHQLLDADLRVTEFSSYGTFLRRKHVTLLIGVQDSQVELALQLIRDGCPTPSGADEHNATIFVLDAGTLVQI